MTHDKGNVKRLCSYIAAGPKQILIFLGYSVGDNVTHVFKTSICMTIMCILYTLRFGFTFYGMASKNAGEAFLAFILNLIVAIQSLIGLQLKQYAYQEKTTKQLNAQDPERNNGYVAAFRNGQEETMTPFTKRYILILMIFIISFIVFVFSFFNQSDSETGEIILGFAFKAVALIFAIIPYADGLIEQAIIWYRAQVD